MNHHHQKDRKWLKDKEPIDSVTKTKANEPSCCSGGDLFRYYEEGTQLVEFEDGVGNNESVTYATRTAIEAAVFELIHQGHDRGYWEIKGKEK